MRRFQLFSTIVLKVLIQLIAAVAHEVGISFESRGARNFIKKLCKKGKESWQAKTLNTSDIIPKSVDL